MTAKPSFAVGDVVTLKGQRQPMTIIDQPQNAISQEGWTWCAYMHAAGVALTLLPKAALAKRSAR